MSKWICVLVTLAMLITICEGRKDAWGWGRRRASTTRRQSSPAPAPAPVPSGWGAWTACENGESKRYMLPGKMSWKIRSCKAGIKAEGAPQPGAESACLQKHNEYRRLHGKKALKWSSTIATSAKQWVQQQSWSRNMQHSTGTGYGENMAWASRVKPGTEGEEAVKRWYDEICLYKQCSPPNKGTGHFTQVVWTDSEFLGCAVVSNRYGVFTVAQYYPPGNYRNEYCKKAGEPAQLSKQRSDAGCKWK